MKIPVSVKLPQRLTNVLSVADALLARGARGVVLYNRFFEPDIDIERMEFTKGNPFSSPSELRSVLRPTALCSAALPQLDLAVSTGVHDGQAAVKALLCGARAVQVCSAIHEKGYGVIAEINRFIDEWAARHGFASLEEFRGKMDFGHPDNDIYQRVQYIGGRRVCARSFVPAAALFAGGGGLCGAFLCEEAVEKPVEPRRVADQGAQLLEPPGILRLGDPEPQVASLAILLAQVFQTAGAVPFAVECGVVVEAVLDGAAHDRHGVDLTVGLGDDASVDRARRPLRRSAVVLHGVAHHGQLLRGEPACKAAVRCEDFGRDEVVAFAARDEPRIVVGRNGVDHVGVDLAACGQLEAAPDDRADVVGAVGAVEAVVARASVGVKRALRTAESSLSDSARGNGPPSGVFAVPERYLA